MVLTERTPFRPSLNRGELNSRMYGPEAVSPMPMINGHTLQEDTNIKCAWYATVQLSSIWLSPVLTALDSSQASIWPPKPGAEILIQRHTPTSMSRMSKGPIEHGCMVIKVWPYDICPAFVCPEFGFFATSFHGAAIAAWALRGTVFHDGGVRPPPCLGFPQRGAIGYDVFGNCLVFENCWSFLTMMVNGNGIYPYNH